MCGLPGDDIRDEHLSNFVLASEGTAPVGVAGLQVLGTSGLIRSVGVAPEHRGHGLAAHGNPGLTVYPCARSRHAAARRRRSMTSTPSPCPPRGPEAGREPRFSRADLDRGPLRPLSEGRWANAVLYRFESGGSLWVVKDFRPRSWLVRNVIGRVLIRREARALARLAGRSTAPRAPFRVDAHALAYRYLEGRNLRDGRSTPGPDFFPDLERAVHDMHAAGGLVHLDLRNAGNVLVTDDGDPVLIDFQSHLRTWWMPGPLRRFVERIDLAAVYKHWANRSPATLGPERAAALERMNRLRPLWALRGYIGSPRGGRPGS